MSLEAQPCLKCGTPTVLPYSWTVDFRLPTEHLEHGFMCSPCYKADQQARGTWFEEDERDEQILSAFLAVPPQAKPH